MGRTGKLLRRHLTMSCTIAPRQYGVADSDNQPQASYGTPVTGVACRRQELSEQDIRNVRQAGTVIFDCALLVPFATAIQPFDIVTAITRANPADPDTPLLVDAGPLLVREVLDRYDDAPQFKRALLVRQGTP